MAIISKERFYEILHKTKSECDGYELHIRHLWLNREYDRLFKSTGLLFEKPKGEDFWEELELRIKIKYNEPGAFEKFLEEAHERLKNK